MVKTKQLKLLVVISFCMLLLCQETMINPVFCFKSDGTVDLEIAVGGFNCPCPHQHGIEINKVKHPAINPMPLCCCDLPLGDTIHSKNIPNGPGNVSLVQVQLDKINPLKPPLFSDILGRNFFRQLPLSKFLLISALPDTSCVFLC